MRFYKGILAVVALSLAISGVSYAKRSKKEQVDTKTVTVKTIAIGDVDAGYTMGGSKPADVKETVQLAMKKQLEKLGKGAYNIKITSPAVVVAGSDPGEGDFPTLSTGRAPTQKEMARYMAAMQRWQNQMTGKVKVHKPVAADAYVEFKLQGSKGGMDTSGAASTIGSLAGIDTSLGNISTKTTKVYLVCTMRDPQTGALIDRYTAKTSSVKFRNLGGFSSYDYGNDDIARERLFKSAVSKCAKWVHKQLK